jgi:hypothetical protein
MKISEKYEKLMEFIYDEYQKSDVARKYGKYASVLVAEFERSTGIDLGDAGSQLEPFRLLYDKGWITLSPKSLVSYARIKPTVEGIEHVEQRRNPAKKVMKVSGDVAEIIGRGLKGFLGK